MAPKGTFVYKNLHVKLRARLTSFVPLDPNSVSVKTDVIWRQRSRFCVTKRSRTQKFMFSHCQSVSNFSKKWKKASYRSRGLFVFFRQSFRKVYQIPGCVFDFLLTPLFTLFNTARTYGSKNDVTRACWTAWNARFSRRMDGGWRMDEDTKIYRLPAQKPLRGNYVTFEFFYHDETCLGNTTHPMNLQRIFIERRKHE